MFLVLMIILQMIVGLTYKNIKSDSEIMGHFEEFRVKGYTYIILTLTFNTGHLYVTKKIFPFGKILSN